MKDKSLRVLIIENSEDDALLIIRELKKVGYNPVYERIETAAAMKKSLKEKQWDIIICDHTLPKFNAPSAIAILKKANVDIPIIIVSGTIGEEKAIECMRLGAQDYILKGNLSRLCPAIGRELKEAKVRGKRKQMEEKLRESEENYRQRVETTHDLIMSVDFDFKITYVNKAIANRVSEFDPIGKNLLDYTPPHGHELQKAIMQKRKEGFSDALSFEWEIFYPFNSTMILDIKSTLLTDDGKPSGVMFVARDITERRQLESQREAALKALQESEQKYRDLSIIDDLTQLYNSRHFYAQLEKEIERSNRYEQPLTLLMLDLDNFKTFNDTYGHVEGDYVLSRLGQVVKRCLRETDSAYRYGGEEFTIMLPMTTNEQAIVTAKRIRTELRKEAFSPVLYQEVYMTVSIGLAQYKLKEEMKAFVQRVDQLMYQAKRNGRNRICPES